MKKRIGISFTTTNFHYYWNWFSANDLGADIELVELSFLTNNVQDIYSCNGFILTGGVDIDPTTYGGPKKYANQPETYQQTRDDFEEKIFRYAQLHTLPLLAICRGMQLVNVLEGGKLLQDLGEGNVRHRKDGDTDKQHEVIVDQNSLLHEITAVATGKINSAHHQAVDKNALGNNLKVSAYAGTQDSTIEALEFKDKTGKAFMLCVQWHPERITDKEQNPFSNLIKERFLEEIRHQP